MNNLIGGNWSWRSVLSTLVTLLFIAAMCFFLFGVTFVLLTPAPLVTTIIQLVTHAAIYESTLVGVILFTLLMCFAP